MARLWLLFLLAVLVCGEVTEEYVTKAIVEFVPANITHNLKEWDKDLVIMFYAPWCVNCDHLLPTWGTIASLKKDNTDVAVGKFDCEASTQSTEICQQLHVDRYPSVLFIGFGNFNQAKGGTLWGKVNNPRLVRFVADLYPEAVYEWVNMLCAMSGWQRKWDDLKGFITGRSRSARQLERLKHRVDVAERKAELFSKELERYKAVELFDTIEDHGDPFTLLHTLEPDEVMNYRDCVRAVVAGCMTAICLFPLVGTAKPAVAAVRSGDGH
jgi:thiol-disulfide isomerase/thioredoxin